MLKKFKSKKGNEILQVLVIVAVIGALAISVTMAISSKIKNETKENISTIGSGLENGVKEAQSEIK